MVEVYKILSLLHTNLYKWMPYIWQDLLRSDSTFNQYCHEYDLPTKILPWSSKEGFSSKEYEDKKIKD